jgi:phospholipase/carboxylesterase
MDKNHIQTLEIGDWVISQRIPKSDGQHPVIFLLHGWTGDESSMWVFASRLPDDALLIAPRAPYTAPMGGYAWHERRSNDWPWIDDFKPAVDSLLEIMTVNYFPLADFNRLQLVGFSQGAALAFSFALLNPERTGSIAGLSGFMPDGAHAIVQDRPLAGKRAFLAHGTKDELVPVEKARQAAGLLEQAGAQVTYCEHDVGHKLSSDCFTSLSEFINSP